MLQHGRSCPPRATRAGGKTMVRGARMERAGGGIGEAGRKGRQGSVFPRGAPPQADGPPVCPSVHPPLLKGGGGWTERQRAYGVSVDFNAGDPLALAQATSHSNAHRRRECLERAAR